MLKEVVAVIRSGKWPDTLARLEEAGVAAYTRYRVYGRGKQRGLRYGGGETESGIVFLPKWLLFLVVEDSRVDSVIRALVDANRTGEIGDGKIFVCPIAGCVRIRTDERQELAVR